MEMSHRTSGDATCPLRSCHWRRQIEVSGGDREFRREQERVVSEHQREAHPWKFIEFRNLAEAAVQQLCDRCGAVVGDSDAHRRWHELAEL